MTDRDILELKSQIQEKQKVLSLYSSIENELEEDDTDFEGMLQELDYELSDTIQSIKDTSHGIADKLHSSIQKKVVANLKASLPYEINGSEYNSAWHEVCEEYQSNGSILGELWNDTLDQDIFTYIKKLSQREQLALKLLTEEADDFLDCWKDQPDEAPTSLKGVNDNLKLYETIDAIRNLIISESIDEVIE